MEFTASHMEVTRRSFPSRAPYSEHLRSLNVGSQHTAQRAWCSLLVFSVLPARCPASILARCMSCSLQVTRRSFPSRGAGRHAQIELCNRSEGFPFWFWTACFATDADAGSGQGRDEVMAGVSASFAGFRLRCLQNQIWCGKPCPKMGFHRNPTPGNPFRQTKAGVKRNPGKEVQSTSLRTFTLTCALGVCHRRVHFSPSSRVPGARGGPRGPRPNKPLSGRLASWCPSDPPSAGSSARTAASHARLHFSTCACLLKSVRDVRFARCSRRRRGPRPNKPLSGGPASWCPSDPPSAGSSARTAASHAYVYLYICCDRARHGAQILPIW